MSKLQPHQQRVVEERTALAVKVQALFGFFSTPVFAALREFEKDLLTSQFEAMSQYLAILTKRTEGYPISTPDPLTEDITGTELAAAGKTGRRVLPADIAALVDQLTYVVVVPKGTTSTFVHAYLGRFYLASGHSACVVPENFVAAIGERIAREDAVKQATKKLWELEGYSLYKELN